MNRIPEPALLPREQAAPGLRCSVCQQQVAEALEVYSGVICRSCLDSRTMDELSALLCAPILTDEL